MNLAASQLDALASDTDIDTITSPAVTTTTETPLEEGPAVVDSLVDSTETPITTTPTATTLQPAQNALQIFLEETRHYRNSMALTQDVHIKSCTIPLALLHRIEAEASCAICREEFAVHPEDQPEPFITLSNAQNEAQCCSHMFHTACLRNWFQAREQAGDDLSCPICRSTESFRQPLYNYRVVADEPAGVVTANRELSETIINDLAGQVYYELENSSIEMGLFFLYHYLTNLSFWLMHYVLEQHIPITISPAELILLITTFSRIPHPRSIFGHSNISEMIMIPPILQVLIPQVLLQGRITPYSWLGSLIGAGIVRLPNIINNIRRIISLILSPEAQLLRRNFSTLSIGQTATRAFAQRAQRGASFVRDASVTATQSFYNVARQGLGTLSTQAQQRAASLWGRVSNGMNSVFRRFAPAGNTVQAATANEPAIELDLENA